SVARIIAKGLARPSSRVSSLGRPKIPAPTMQLMTRAVIAQRPIDRTKAIVRLSCCGGVYHGRMQSLEPHSDEALAPSNAFGIVPESQAIRKERKSELRGPETGTNLVVSNSSSGFARANLETAD